MGRLAGSRRPPIARGDQVINLMREGLRHIHSGMGDADFFKMIDSTGGWPVGYQYVGFEHTENRAAGFCNASSNSGYWTVLANADDYYLWKLSPEALQRIADGVRNSISLTAVDAKRICIRNWRGYSAVISEQVTK